MILKFGSKRFRKTSSSKSSGRAENNNKGIISWGRTSSNKSDKSTSSSVGSGGRDPADIKWELRPGGMLVQMRDDGRGTAGDDDDVTINIKVSTVSHCHDVSVQSTSTFGGLKNLLAMTTGLEPREQRLLYRGKEREDDEHLHMVGVRDGDKILLLEDPAIKEEKKNLLRTRLLTAGDSLIRNTIAV